MTRKNQLGITGLKPRLGTVKKERLFGNVCWANTYKKFILWYIQDMTGKSKVFPGILRTGIKAIWLELRE